MMYIATALVLAEFARYAWGVNLVDYVDPSIGTSVADMNNIDSRGDYGNTFPSVGVPNAHSPWSPDTTATESKCVAPYTYIDSHFIGLRKTHFMSGSCVIDYGSMTIIPSLSLDVEGALTFHTLSHEDEIMTPGYYKNYLKESGIQVEATNDDTSGILRLNAGQVAQETYYVLVTAFDSNYNQSTVELLSDEQMTLSNPVHKAYQGSGHPAGFSGHHFLQFSDASVSRGVILGDGEVVEYIKGADRARHTSRVVAAYYEFKSDATEPLYVAVGSSFVNADKAKNNLLLELGDGMFDFDAMVDKVTAAWEEKLNAVVVSDLSMRADYNDSVSLSNLRMFYTSLWHSLLLPRHHSDKDGEYLSFDGSLTVMKAEGFTYLDDFSTWDVFRSTIPLVHLLYSDTVTNMVQSLVVKAEQGGWLPIFPAWNSYTGEMIGDHCAAVIADAYVKGLLDSQDELAHQAWEVIRKNAFEMPPVVEYVQGKGRRGLDAYLQYGFIPLEVPLKTAFHKGEQASRTLEYAYDDYAIAQFAQLMGQTEDATALFNRSQFFRNVIDAEGVGFVRGRHANGSWGEDDDSFDPDSKYHWLTEATPWQYTWFVPHQVEQLMEMYGGQVAFTDKLDDFFTGDHYNHGNEPDHQVAFMYAYVDGDGFGSWRVQQQVRATLASAYSDTPGGMAGNEDAGQMSSWMVLSALGLFQVCPGCGGHSEYVLSSPVFDSTSINIGGNSFSIFALKNSEDDRYIQSAALNGVTYDCAFIAHSKVVAGGTLEFVMGSVPNKAWGSSGRACLDNY